jgi:predicted HicB family RNase H-like nuclease
MTIVNIDSDVASNAHLSDKELARVLKVGTRRVAAVRASLGIPPHKPTKTQDANLWIRCPQATRTAVEALASAEGVTMSAWCAAAIVERMERVQGRMQALREPTDYIGSP